MQIQNNPLSEPYKIINKFLTLEQMRDWSPSEWKASVEDGRWVYIRYNWGMLKAFCADTYEEAREQKSDHLFFLRDTLVSRYSVPNSCLESIMTTEEMLKNIGFTYEN